MQKASAGFWSYVIADDEYERGRIAKLRERLRQSVRFYTRASFEIFLDKKDIAWGQQWEERIKNSLNDALLLFSIITPSYFTSKACREEFLAFRKRQEQLGRDDLILPVYYLTTEILEGAIENGDSDQTEIAQYFLNHQFEDFRSLRTSEETDPSYAQAIERLGQRAVEALRRSRVVSEGIFLRDATAPKVSKNEAEDVSESASVAAQHRDNAAPGHITSLSVNQMPGRADFTTIVDAVARAPGGARIVVHPGRYREKVVIDKPLELVGSGNMEDIVIESNEGEPLTFDTNIGLVQNLTIRQTKPYDETAKTRDFGVWIKQGRLELENCDVSSTDGACICATNEADPRIRRNRIHNGRQSGIFITGRARGVSDHSSQSILWE
jgi:TIR domain/Right handed beta helix region